MTKCSSRTSPRMRTASSSTPSLTHEPRSPRTGRHRYRRLRRAPHSEGPGTERSTGRCVKVAGHHLVCHRGRAALRGQARRMGSCQAPATGARTRTCRYRLAWAEPRRRLRHPAGLAWCVKAWHVLGQREHEADRWVAVTAIWPQPAWPRAHGQAEPPPRFRGSAPRNCARGIRVSPEAALR